MLKNVISTLLIGASLSVSAVTINLRPGELADKLKTSTPSGTLTLTGGVNATDLNLLRTLSGVEILDLSQAPIADVETASLLVAGRSLFAADHLPSYILFEAPYSRVILPTSLTTIEAGAMAGSNITEIAIPEGVTSIGEFAFYGCPNLKRVSLPSTLLTIGRAAFANCRRLESINLEDTKVRTLPQECFASTPSLRQIEASGIQSLGSRVFALSGVKKLDIPNATEMQPFALADMTDLMVINAGPGVNFSEGALLNCRSLVAINGMPEKIPDLFAANCGNLESSYIFAGAASVGRYSMANSGVAKIILGPDLAMIDENALKGAASLTAIDATALGENIPGVAKNSFAGLDVSKIALKVADDTETLWKSHPVWRDFNIYSDKNPTTIDTIHASGDDISISLTYHTLTIIAPEDIQAAGIYDASGTLLMPLTPIGSQLSADISQLPSGVVIIAVNTATRSKATKLLL